MSENLQETYNKFKAHIEKLQEKGAELREEIEQHHKVLAVLSKTDADRNAMQMIGTVLVEKKVKDVIPALHETLKGLEKAVEQVEEEQRLMDSRFTRWKQENKVKVVSA